MERRAAIHLDEIEYVLGLPNKERYASTLLGYEEKYVSFTKDPEDRTESGAQTSTSDAPRERLPKQRPKKTTSDPPPPSRIATVVVAEGGASVDSAVIPEGIPIGITLAVPSSQRMFRPKAPVPVRPGQKRKQPAPSSQPEKLPEPTLTLQASRTQALLDEEEDIDDLLEGAQQPKKARTQTPPPAPAITDLTGSPSTPSRGSSPATLWRPNLEHEGRKLLSTDSIYLGSPNKAMALAEALKLPADVERHANRSIREAHLLAVKHILQVRIFFTVPNFILTLCPVVFIVLPLLFQSCQLTQDMGRRLFEYEAENTKLLKESHASLQQINDLTDQLHKDRDTIMRLTEDLSKYESASETAKKIMDDTLAIAEECRRRQDVAEEELKIAKVKAEEDKNAAAQAAYDACFDSLTEDYAAQAKAAFDDAYRQS